MQPSAPERVIVLGAGAIGASIGALLFERGARCVLVARGEHGRAMAERGVTLQLPDAERSIRAPVVQSVEEARPTPRDLVLLATMGHHTDAALSDVPADVPVASLQNGLAPLDVLARRAVTPRIATMVYVPAERREAGVIALPGVPTPGCVLVGDWPRGAGPWSRWLAAALAGAGFRAEHEADMAPWVRAKLLTNLAGIVVALCDAPPADVIEAAQAEARAVWRARGEPFADVPELLARVGPMSVAPVRGRARVGGSTRAALVRGDRLETRCLHQPVVDAGRASSIPTPVNEALIVLADRAERERLAPGSLDADSLRRAVGLL